MIDDEELARRSLLAFGEMAAALGRFGVDPAVEVRRPDAIGARIDVAADNPWFDAAVVPVGATPPPDDQLLPSCLWTVDASVPGRVEDPEIATPCMALDLADLVPRPLDPPPGSATPGMAVLGAMNEAAYEDEGTFAPLAMGLDADGRMQTHGIVADGAFVCVGLTMRLGDDLGVFYLATAAGARRRGLASGLVTSMLEEARDDGCRTATLQASPDGIGVYQRLGFRTVAVARGFLRPR